MTTVMLFLRINMRRTRMLKCVPSARSSTATLPSPVRSSPPSNHRATNPSGSYMTTPSLSASSCATSPKASSNFWTFQCSVSTRIHWRWSLPRYSCIWVSLRYRGVWRLSMGFWQIMSKFLTRGGEGMSWWTVSVASVPSPMCWCLGPLSENTLPLSASSLLRSIWPTTTLSQTRWLARRPSLMLKMEIRF